MANLDSIQKDQIPTPEDVSATVSAYNHVFETIDLLKFQNILQNMVLQERDNEFRKEVNEEEQRKILDKIEIKLFANTKELEFMFEIKISGENPLLLVNHPNIFDLYPSQIEGFLRAGIPVVDLQGNAAIGIAESANSFLTATCKLDFGGESF